MNSVLFNKKLLGVLIRERKTKPALEGMGFEKIEIDTVVKQGLAELKAYDHTPAGEHHEKEVYARITDAGKEALAKGFLATNGKLGEDLQRAGKRINSPKKRKMDFNKSGKKGKKRDV
jgi:hypothetical protein